jgi:malate dehydrogenase (quinone)
MHNSHSPNIVLIGAGIMSATLGTILKELDPDISITVIERLDVAAAESSDAWNNAGTGHSAFCELNYTPQKEDGHIDISKAIEIAESFEVSRQFWAYMVREHGIDTSFIHRVPHMSFVWGQENCKFLELRYQAMIRSPLFSEMEFTNAPAIVRKWAPLIMDGREGNEPLAATKMPIGTDVNFGALTRFMFNRLMTLPNVTMLFGQEVRDLDKQDTGDWRIQLRDLHTKRKQTLTGDFVFIGAGGGSLPLLEKSGIEEGKGFGGFPVSGQWLKCVKKDIIERHAAKVYGKAAVGSPPMSVPHLDTRIINGEKALLFGPYAGFSTKFLKHGSYLDLPASIRFNNVLPMVAAGVDNIPLTKYLIDQVLQSPEDRLAALREYFPAAQLDDWELEIAGQRVQVIKKDKEHTGVLEFGTEVVSAADGSLAALLGASPGASTAVAIMISLLNKCFGERINSPAWKEKMHNIFPTYGASLHQNPTLCEMSRKTTSQTLNLL